MPQDGVISLGSGSISQAGQLTTISQQSQGLVINWRDFSIAPAETVRFLQPSANAIAVNRVGGANPSSIFGTLRSNGQVFLINPNGILFGPAAEVNVGGLIASVQNLSDSDFAAGNFRFGSDTGNRARVVNQGILSAADGGYIALLASQTINEGVISAHLGTVVMAAGRQTTLRFDGRSVLGFSVDQGVVNALAENRQLINADGGQVFMSARAAETLSSAVVSNSGIIEARRLENTGGVIRLIGDMQSGRVDVTGTLDASALGTGNGGFVETSAARVKIADSAKIDTSALRGRTGTWLVDPVDFTVADSGGDITPATLAGQLALNNVTLLSTMGTTTGNGDLFVNSPLSWTGANSLTLNAERNINVNAAISNLTGGSLAMRADVNGSGNGSVQFGAAGSVATTGAGRTDLYYNPAAYTAPTSFGGKISGAYTAWMLVNNLSQLQNISSASSGSYALGRDIDASATAGWNAGAGFMPITSFSGKLDGLGHAISGLYINRPSTAFAGLIGTSTGAISNLDLLGGSVTGLNITGALAGQNNGTVSNVHSSVAVTGTNTTGGLVGNNFGAVDRSSSSGTVNGTTTVGGLLGSNSGAAVSLSYATGSVTSSQGQTGGLIGRNTGGAISGSYASGAVTALNTVGGLIGSNNSATVTDAYATGTVLAGSDLAGGLIGANNSGSTILRSHASGAVSGSNGVLGGLIGANSASNISYAYASGNVNGLSSLGGLLGTNSGASAIQYSYATGNVTGSSNQVGGLIGVNSSSSTAISMSFATGNVRGTNLVGGLIGLNNGPLNNVYATGNVSATLNTAGGLIGNNNGAAAVVSKAYASGLISAPTILGGIAGGNSGSISNAYWNAQLTGINVTAAAGTNAGGTGLSNAQMLSAAAYAGFDFSTVWRIYDGHTMPLLKAFLTPLTITADNISKVYDGVAVGALQNASYSVAGANTSGHLYGLGSPYATGRNAGSYSVNGNIWSDQFGYDLSLSGGLLTISRAPLTVAALAASKPYDTGTTATVTLSDNRVAGDTLTITSAAASFADKTAGTGKVVNVTGISVSGADAGNYDFNTSATTTADITRASLTLSGSATADKVYDGTTSAALSAGSLAGVLGGDVVTAAGAGFADRNVGTGKQVNVVLGGADAVNYILTQPGLTASITPASLTLTGAVAADKTYDGTASATVTGGSLSGLLGADHVSLAAANFSDASVGNSKLVTILLAGADLGNYTFTQPGLRASIKAIESVVPPPTSVPVLPVSPAVPEVPVMPVMPDQTAGLNTPTDVPALPATANTADTAMVRQVAGTLLANSSGPQTQWQADTTSQVEPAPARTSLPPCRPLLAGLHDQRHKRPAAEPRNWSDTMVNGCGW